MNASSRFAWGDEDIEWLTGGPDSKEMIIQFRVKGSSKSGNRGHAGIPGHLGGSAPKKPIYSGPPSEFSNDNMRSIGDLQIPEKWIADAIDSVGDDYGFGKPYYIAPNTHELIDATKASRNMSHEATAVELARLNPEAFGEGVFSSFNPWVRKTRAFDKMLDLGFIRVRKYSKMDKSVVYSQTMDTPQLRRLQDLVTNEKIPYTSKIVIGWARDQQGKSTGDRSFMEFSIGDFMMLKHAVWRDGELAFKESSPITHFRVKGSSKSGNYGHAGRPGKVGGSSPRRAGDITQATYHRLEDMPSYQQYGNDVLATEDNPDNDWMAHPQDDYMKAMLHDQGFDNLPDVVSSKELDGYVAKGEYEVWRGVHDSKPGDGTADAAPEQFRSGDLYVGRGIYGNGTYASSGLGEAIDYSGGAWTDGKGATITRMTIKPGARIISIDKVVRQMERGNDPAPVTADPGRWAAVHGYDLIYVKGDVLVSRHGMPPIKADDQWVIINRTAVRVDQHTYSYDEAVNMLDTHAPPMQVRFRVKGSSKSGA